MNINDIKTLAEIMKKNDLTCLEVHEDNIGIKLKREINVMESAKLSQQVKLPSIELSTDKPEDIENYSNAKEIKAPMVGVFYNSSSPDQEPFVKIGDTVKKGDIICVIEAMKLFNEITAEFDGTVIDICADNEQVVEFGQTLLKLLP